MTVAPGRTSPMPQLATAACLATVITAACLVTIDAAQASGTREGSVTHIFKNQKGRSQDRISGRRTGQPHVRSTLQATLQGQTDGDYQLEISYGRGRHQQVQVFPLEIRAGQSSLNNPVTGSPEAVGHTSIHNYISTYASFAPNVTFRILPAR